jgi:hypothetical protein
MGKVGLSDSCRRMVCGRGADLWRNVHVETAFSLAEGVVKSLFHRLGVQDCSSMRGDAQPKTQCQIE